MKATNKKNVKETNTVKKTTTPKVETTSKTTTAKSTATTKTKGMLTTLKSLLDSGKITDKKLKAEVQNSLKVKNPTAEAVSELLKRVIDSGKQPVVANETKPTVKKTVTKKTEEKSTTKKPVAKAEPEKPVVKSLQSSGDKTPPTALYFPDSTTVHMDTENGSEDVTLKRVTDDKFTTMDELIDYIKDNDAIDKVFIACYWTARHIKQFNYAALNKIDPKVVPKSFTNDLDITQVITYSDKINRIWSMSIYTDAMYFFLDSELKPITDTNPYNGEKYSVRVSNGMEFAIYIVDEKPRAKSRKTK